MLSKVILDFSKTTFSGGQGRVVAVDDSTELYTQIKIIKCNSSLEGNV